MKNVITALCNPLLNDRLKEVEGINVLSNDIQYQEGIFDIIDNNNFDVDYLIISELILEKFCSIDDLVKIIKQKYYDIKIILILENKDEELENLLYSKGVYKIFYNNKVEIKEIISLIINSKNNENDKIIKELEDLKNIIMKNRINNTTNENSLEIDNISDSDKTKSYSCFFNNMKKNIINKMSNNSKIDRNKTIIKKIGLLNNKKIISILGTGGVRQKYYNPQSC